MNEESLFSAAKKMAAGLDSLYRGISANRMDLLDFMDINGWFGVTPEIKDGTPVITGRDFALFRKPLTLWLSAYKKPGRDKIRLMLEHFDGTYPLTCRFYREFVVKNDLEDVPAAWKLLDYLLAEIDREITAHSGDELEKMVYDLNAIAPRNMIKLFAAFLRTTEHNGAPLTQWAYTFDAREAPERVNDAYQTQNFAVMAYYIFNENMWAEKRLIEKAAQSSLLADLWLYAALHFVCALRRGDMARLPAPALPYDGKTVRQKISEGTFSRKEAIAVAEEMCVRLKLKPIQPSKTSAYENIPMLKLFVPESLKAPLGVIVSIALAHHPEVKPGEEFVFPVKDSIRRVRTFFGEDFLTALGNRSFSSRRCNKAYLQGIDGVAGPDDTYGKPKGYMLAALARSHKGGIGSLAKTTDIYLKDARFSGYTPEFIIREMFERGVFSFIPAVLLEMYAGDAYKSLPVRSQTKLIGVIGLAAYQIEGMAAAANRALEKSIKAVSTVLSSPAKMHERVFELLQNIASGSAPGRQEDCLCLMTAAGFPCAFADRDACIGCGYEIFTKAAIHTLMKEYARLARLKRSANHADAWRYEKMLNMAILPAVSEMTGSIQLLYPEADMTAFLDIVERGIQYADSNA